MPSPTIAKILPLFVRGKVVKGFGRGSKQLGIPTANFSEDIVENLPSTFDTGIYYGWASVNRGHIYKAVLSVGWNPFYKNQKKSMETHIINQFDEDFYGKELSVAVLGYIRPERTYPSLESLIEAIHGDIKEAEANLDLVENKDYLNHEFFSQISQDFNTDGVYTS